MVTSQVVVIQHCWFKDQGNNVRSYGCPESYKIEFARMVGSVWELMWHLQIFSTPHVSLYKCRFPLCLPALPWAELDGPIPTKLCVQVQGIHGHVLLWEKKTKTALTILLRRSGQNCDVTEEWWKLISGNFLWFSTFWNRKCQDYFLSAFIHSRSRGPVLPRPNI